MMWQSTGEVEIFKDYHSYSNNKKTMDNSPNLNFSWTHQAVKVTPEIYVKRGTSGRLGKSEG